MGELARTLNVKVLIVVATPSSAVMVRTVVPTAEVRGTIVSERFAPLPRSTMPVFGTMAWLDEVTRTVGPAGAPSTSPTLNGTGPTVVSCIAT